MPTRDLLDFEVAVVSRLSHSCNQHPRSLLRILRILCPDTDEMRNCCYYALRPCATDLVGYWLESIPIECCVFCYCLTLPPLLVMDTATDGQNMILILERKACYQKIPAPYRWCLITSILALRDPITGIIYRYTLARMTLKLEPATNSSRRGRRSSGRGGCSCGRCGWRLTHGFTSHFQTLQSFQLGYLLRFILWGNRWRRLRFDVPLNGHHCNRVISMGGKLTSEVGGRAALEKETRALVLQKKQLINYHNQLVCVQDISCLFLEHKDIASVCFAAVAEAFVPVRCLHMV